MKKQVQQPLEDTAATTHISFLLRLWRAGTVASSNWQASLEILGSDHRVGFANLEQLFAYLMDLIEGTAGTPQKAEEKGACETSNKS